MKNKIALILTIFTSLSFLSSCNQKDAEKAAGEILNELEIKMANLAFESEDFNLVTDTVGDYEMSFNTGAWFKFSYNSGTTPKAYLVMNISDSVQFYEVNKDNLEDITQNDIDSATFSTTELTHCATDKIYLLTKGSDVYLLHYTGENVSTGVDFEYAIWPTFE